MRFYDWEIHIRSTPMQWRRNGSKSGGAEINYS